MVEASNEVSVWRADALYTELDGIAETRASLGPFGSLGHLTCWFNFGTCCRMKNFDINGRRVSAQNTPELEVHQSIIHLTELDASFRSRFADEMRSLILFHALILATVEVLLARELMCFHRFVRENRFKLHAYGISPPVDFMRESCELNIRLVTSWLESLSPDQRERFLLLHDNFKVHQSDLQSKSEQRCHDQIAAATQLAIGRRQREQLMFEKQQEDFSVRRSRRLDTWIASLGREDRDRVTNLLLSSWEADDFCHVDPKDDLLHKAYQVHVLLENNETISNCRERLADLEAGQSDCYPSRTRKGALQFIDPEFSPSPEALGPCLGAAFVGTWSHALSVNPHAVLFAESSEPTDVRPGICVDDSWLVDSIAMLAASGHAGSSGNVHIKHLFINMIDLEGNIIYDSAVGAFGVKLFVNGRWEALVVDDALPMLGDGARNGGIDALVAMDAHEREAASDFSCAYDTNHVSKNDYIVTNNSNILESYDRRYGECAGCAVAHSVEMTELWVSLLEKGVAKYYGSYSNIEAGFVHQGLELLTGCRTDCIYIPLASRGFGRHAIWGKLLQYHRNEYILGARVVPAEYAALSLQASGLLFDSTYLIYDVVEVIPEGHKLIKLCNPAGHGSSFRGLWSNSSPSWTSSLRNKLLRDLEPKAFWISFDEFCCAFDSLYICHYYSENSNRWQKYLLSGEWTRAHTRCQENTAAGLPSLHNPGCEVERNPQYSVIVHRPSTLRISISQKIVNKEASVDILPIAGYLCNTTDLQKKKAVNRITKLSHDNIIACTGKARCERTVEMNAENLSPGTYVLLIGTLQAQVEGKFTASVISCQKNYC